jgi:hypothetical protein
MEHKMTIEPTELTELTPEQKLAVEQRKERLKVNREIEERERAARGRRRVMDPDATLKMLVQQLGQIAFPSAKMLVSGLAPLALQNKLTLSLLQGFC